jgi:ribosomal protein L32
MLWLFLIVSYVFCSTKTKMKRANRICLQLWVERGRGRLAQIMYTHVSKYTNDEIIGEIKKGKERIL